MGMEHVSTRGDPAHVHLLQAHGTRASGLPQLLLSSKHVSFSPLNYPLDLSGGPEGLHASYLLLEGGEDLGAEAGEGHVDVGVHGEADKHGETGGGQQAQD